MKLIKRILAVLILTILMVTPLVQAQDQPAFAIGVLDNSDGSIGHGAQLGAERFNRFGGVRGADGTLYRLDLIIEPFDPTTIANTVNTFSSGNVIAVIGPDEGAPLVENLATLQTLQVPILTPANDDPLLQQDTTGLVYRTRARSLEESRALAAYLTRDSGYQNIAVIQLDMEPMTQVDALAFTNVLPITPVSNLVLETADQVNDAAAQLTTEAPEVVVAYGDPASAAALVNALRAAGFAGFFAYADATELAFAAAVPPEQRGGILSTATWTIANEDEASNSFTLNYVQAFSAVPTAMAAASYDAVQTIAAAITAGGEFNATLDSLTNLGGVQGILATAELEPRELSNAVSIIAFNAFGSAETLARYAGDVRLPDDVFAIVTSPVQNVRVGPSIDFEILGQIEQATRLPLLGTNVAGTWVVVDFRGQQGWMAAYLLDIRGNLNTIPLIDEPPAPTPDANATIVPTATVAQAAAPTNEADIVIDSAVVAPFPIVPNTPFDITVTLRNAGLTDAPEFAVATTLAPNEVYLAAIVPGLAAGQTTTTVVNGTLANTGAFVVDIVADLNNQVVESPAGEANNAFPFTYVINKNVKRQDMRPLNPGDVMDLEGDTVEDQNLRMDDLQWDGNNINTIGNARVLLLNPGTDGFDWANSGVDPANNVHWNLTNPDVVSRIHWDLIDPNVVNQPNIPTDQVTPGAIIGVITSDGRRGLLRIDERLEGNQLQVTFLVYEE